MLTDSISFLLKKSVNIGSGRQGTGGYRVRSHDILEAWSQPLLEVPQARDLSSVVQAVVDKSLPTKEPTDDHDPPVADVLLYCGDEDVSLTQPLELLRSSIYALEKYGDNEDSLHSLVDRLILHPEAE